MIPLLLHGLLIKQILSDNKNNILAKTMPPEAPKVAVNYFYSYEFLSTLKAIGITSIPYLILLQKTGFTLEGVLTLIFAGVIGGAAIAKKDLEVAPNLYTPKGIVGRDPAMAIRYVAENIALEEAKKREIPREADDRINEVASAIMDNMPMPSPLKPFAKGIATDFFKGIFK